MATQLCAMVDGVKEWISLPLPESLGGTGEGSYTSGQISIGNVAGGLTKSTISIVAHQTTISNGDGSITIGTVQDIDTSSSPEFSNLTLTTKLDTPLIQTASGLTVKAGSSPLIIQQGTGSSGAIILDGATNGGPGVWLTRASNSEDGAHFHFFTNNVLKWESGLHGDGSEDFVFFNNSASSYCLRLRSTTNNVEVANNILVGTSAAPTGAVSSIALSGSTLGAVDGSVVSFGAAAIGGVRRFGVQAGTGDVISLGADRLDFAAATGYLSIAGTDVLSATSTAVTITGLTATNAVLTTPNIGTPSAGVLTNCTGLPVGGGGTGQSSYTDGQLLIGNTAGNTLTKATLTQTANQVLVTNGNGSITLSLPQSIATTSTPQFARMGIGVAASANAAALLCIGGNPVAFTSANYMAVVDSSAGGAMVLSKDANNYAIIQYSNASSAFTFATVEASTPFTQTFGCKSGNVIVGGLAISTGATKNLIYSGGSTSPVLGAATADLVSTCGFDRVNTRHAAAGNRVKATQSERGSPIYIGDDAIDFAATTALITVNATDILTMTSTSITLADAVNIAVNATTGTKIGTAITQKLGFYNATPIAQRAGAAQAAIATTASTQTTPWGYSTQAQADAIVTLANELRAWAVAQGFIKGAA